MARSRARPHAPITFESSLWARGLAHVAGVDEAGAGPLAGPVVAAAVILPVGLIVPGVTDSKLLTHARRLQLCAQIQAEAIAWSLGLCTVDEIDALNILRASRRAMSRAVWALPQAPQHLLVDARQVPGVSMPQTPLVHGDSRSQCIAAASIVAKVSRDALMAAAALRYPAYGFERHRGYGTARHLTALREHGPCVLHRRSFAPVRALLPAPRCGGQVPAVGGFTGGCAATAAAPSGRRRRSRPRSPAAGPRAAAASGRQDRRPGWCPGATATAISMPTAEYRLARRHMRAASGERCMRQRCQGAAALARGGG